jgi:hypothetical protein
MLGGAVTVEKPRGGLSPDAYDAGWDSWNDMIRYSPAPWHRWRLITRLAGSVPFASTLEHCTDHHRVLEHLRKMTAGHLILTGAGRQFVALARAF